MYNRHKALVILVVSRDRVLDLLSPVTTEETAYSVGRYRVL
jgi:hypothetical protein